MKNASFTIRRARPADVPHVVRLIRDLAAYEQLSDECQADEDRLREHMFGPRPHVEVEVAETSSGIVGFALFFENYSTFLTKPGLFLEDLFVEPDHRGCGIGKALLQRIVDLAADRGCGRVEWHVLDWNESAIQFYRDGFGATPVEGWTVYRLTDGKITAAAHAT